MVFLNVTLNSACVCTLGVKEITQEALLEFYMLGYALKLHQKNDCVMLKGLFTVTFHIVLERVLTSFSLFLMVLLSVTSLFWFSFIVLILFSSFNRFLFLEKKTLKIHCPLLIRIQQKDPIRDQLVNIVKHLAAKEPEISLRNW